MPPALGIDPTNVPPSPAIYRVRRCWVLNEALHPVFSAVHLNLCHQVLGAWATGLIFFLFVSSTSFPMVMFGPLFSLSSGSSNQSSASAFCSIRLVSYLYLFGFHATRFQVVVSICTNLQFCDSRMPFLCVDLPQWCYSARLQPALCLKDATLVVVISHSGLPED